MSRTREYEVEVISSDRKSGTGITLNATTPERAEKRARAQFKGTEFHDGTFSAKEVQS